MENLVSVELEGLTLVIDFATEVTNLVIPVTPSATGVPNNQIIANQLIALCNHEGFHGGLNPNQTIGIIDK